MAGTEHNKLLLSCWKSIKYGEGNRDEAFNARVHSGMTEVVGWNGVGDARGRGHEVELVNVAFKVKFDKSNASLLCPLSY